MSNDKEELEIIIDSEPDVDTYGELSQESMDNFEDMAPSPDDE